MIRVIVINYCFLVSTQSLILTITSRIARTRQILRERQTNWLIIIIHYRNTKYKKKKETYGCPPSSLGYRIPLLIAGTVYQVTVECQSHRVLYSQRWVWNHHQHSKCMSKRSPFLIALQPCSLPSWCLSGIAGVATCRSHHIKGLPDEKWLL